MSFTTKIKQTGEIFEARSFNSIMRIVKISTAQRRKLSPVSFMKVIVMLGLTKWTGLQWCESSSIRNVYGKH